MLFKSIIDSPCGIRFLFDSLPLCSGCGRKKLLESPMMEHPEEVRAAYAELAFIHRIFVRDAVHAPLRRKLTACLMTLRDISGTIARLEGNGVLDEVEFFEVKCLCLLCARVKDILAAVHYDRAELPDLETVLSRLDPEGTRIPSFYIYDSYSPELKEIRAGLRKLGGYRAGIDAASCDCAGNAVPETVKNEGTEEKWNVFAPVKNGGDKTSADRAGIPEAVPGRVQAGEDRGESRETLKMELTERARVIEAKVREELSGQIKKYAPALQKTLDLLAGLDILLAKAIQTEELGLVFPRIAEDGQTLYKGMFHPRIKRILSEKGKEYTPVDIRFGREAVTIIGANMGGKTVALKTVALCQYLCQFGFGIPAQSSCIDLKRDVELCVGDKQDEVSGLSSFAAEIAAIDRVIRRVRRGEYILALIDEPARTTNPVEGTALVSALLKILEGQNLSLLLTTHYNISGEHFRRLRVAGLVDGTMDYRLTEAGSGDIPQEAVHIARKLGADERWIEETEKILNTTI